MHDLHRLARHFEIKRDQLATDYKIQGLSPVLQAEFKMLSMAFDEALRDVQVLLIDSDALLSTEVGAQHTLSADVKCPRCSTLWTPSVTEEPLQPICGDCHHECPRCARIVLDLTESDWGPLCEECARDLEEWDGDDEYAREWDRSMYADIKANQAIDAMKNGGE